MNKKKMFLNISILLFFVSIFSMNYISQEFGKNYKKTEYSLIRTRKPMEFFEKQMTKKLDELDLGIKKITIAATGDIMFHGPQIKGAYESETKTYDFNSTFEPIKKYIESADIAIGNFETVTAGPEHRYIGYPRFNSPKTSLEALKNVGYDILSTANNHSLDRGKEGIIETIENINSYGLKNIGTYKEPNDKIYIRNVEGMKIAFLSYTYGCNELESLLTDEELNYMVNRIDDEKIEKDITKAKSENVDFVIVFIHWGNEYKREATLEQKELAQKMFDWGADAILGSHPHVIQKSEIVKVEGEDKFVIYSMGNFISNQRFETVKNRYTEDGVIVRLNLEKDLINDKTRIESVDYIPT